MYLLRDRGKETMEFEIAKEVTVDLRENVEGFNRACDNAKIGFRMVFPEKYGSLVEFYCFFQRRSKNNEMNACIINIVNVNNELRYVDVNEEGKSVNHIWLKNVYKQENVQCELWKSVQEGDKLRIRGILWYYDDCKKNIRKPCIENPEILQIERNGKKVYG